MVMFEDLHWIDEETQALLNLLADSIGTAQVLLLVNYRPEYRISGATRPTIRSCGSTRSARRAPTRCFRRCSAMVPIWRRSSGSIIERTEGNPFFMEETVQALFDEGALVRNGAR